MKHSSEIQRIRHATRQIVRDLDFMKGSVLQTGCSASEIHILLELENSGELAVSELADRLRQDKSTASRNVKALVKAGYVQKLADPKDKRVYRLSLTPAGLEKAASVNQLANSQVGEALELLDEEDCQQAVHGIELYARALQRSYQLYRIVIRPVEARDNEEMGQIIRRVMTEFGAVGAGYSIEDSEVDDIHGAYAGDRARYFIAEREGTILGGAGFAPLEGEQGSMCELRKMYLLPEGRRIGLGRKLLALCLEEARGCGYEQCYLETLRRMGQAQQLYAKFGFESLKGPKGATGHFGCDAWSVKRL